jgi:cell division protein FtsB
MLTRIKRPSVWRPLIVTALLVAFQGYLGYNAWRGQFGIESRHEMARQIEDLDATSASLQAEIDAYRHRVDLFRPEKLDPDILTERARALLGMARPDDLVVVIDPVTRLPQLGAQPALDGAQVASIIGGVH